MTSAKHILVVEDERHLAMGIKFNLEGEGYRVTTVAAGRRRWSCWSRERSRNRSDHPRHHAAGHERLFGVRGAARSAAATCRF